MIQTPRILVISPNWVGDAVMAQVLIEGLKKRYEYCEIDILSPSSCSEIWLRVPDIRQVFSEVFLHGAIEWKKRWKWAQKIRGSYDQAIILPNSIKSALIPFFAGIPLRTGYWGEMRRGLLNDGRALDKEKYPRWIDRCYALSFTNPSTFPNTIPAPILLADKEAQKNLLKRLTLSLHSPAIALCPGAEFGPAKQWPLHHWIECAKQLLDAGYQVWVIGGPKDQNDGALIAEAAPGARSLCGSTSLGEAVDLLDLATAVVANDSGLLHIAAALGKPAIGLYGSTSSKYAPPTARWPGQTQVLEVLLACRPCQQRVCPLGHKQCLEDILPQQVLKAINLTLDNQKAGYMAQAIHFC